MSLLWSMIFAKFIIHLGSCEPIETVAGQLEQRFSIKTTFAGDLWHLTNRIIRKILSHAIYVLLNIKMNIELLKLRLFVN